MRGPTDRPRRTLHVGYHNRDAYNQGPAPMPADAAESAKQAARAFVAGVPPEYLLRAISMSTYPHSF